MFDAEKLAELSERERELLKAYTNGSHDFPGTTVTGVLTEDSATSEKDRDEVAEDILLLFSESTNPVDLQTYSLLNLRAKIKNKSDRFPSEDKNLPDDATVTPEKLNRLLIKDKIRTFFTLVGSMIERFSIELILEDVVDEDRISESVREDIERKSQSERLWLLYITGVVDEGEKGKIGRAYDIRSSLVHDNVRASIIDEVDNIESDIERSLNAVDTLHQKLYGISLRMRATNSMMDE